MGSDSTDTNKEKDLEHKIDEIYKALVGDFEKPGLIGRVVTLEKYRKTQLATLTLVIGVIVDKMVEVFGH